MGKGQRGVSVMGLIIGLVILIILALFAMKVVPSFLEYRAAKGAIEQIGKQAQSPQEARRAFESRATIDDITSIKAADLTIGREGNELVISFAYRKEIPLFANVGLHIDYAANSKGQ